MIKKALIILGGIASLMLAHSAANAQSNGDWRIVMTTHAVLLIAAPIQMP